MNEALGDYFVPSEAVFGSGTSFFDYNNDGLDDLTFCSNNSGVFTWRNNGEGFDQDWFFTGLTGLLMQPAWVDIDNDGDNDFFVSRYDETPLLYLNDGSMNFIDISDHLPCPDLFPASTGASWGDFNNDSFLDLYMCNYHNQGVGPTSWLFQNNGDGTFIEVASQMNCDNGISMAFQSIWIDLDDDHDQDLVVVNDNNDGSKMYINEGVNGFNNIATLNGFDVLGDLMGVSFSDLEHDGDYDFMITNNQGNILMINDSGQYSNKANQYGVDVYCTSWGCLFIDAANDTYEDLYVLSNALCSNNSNYFYDNTDGYHLNLNDPMIGGDLPAYSCSKGDYNLDGKYDIIITNGYQTIDMQLWQNKFATGNYIKLDLNGTISNLHGIGSTVKCYVNDQMLLRSFSSGDNYLSQDSQYLIIGTAQDETVDSLIIQWPSGWTDKFYDLPVNQLYTITEGETFATEHEIQFYAVCPGGEVTLFAPEGNNHVWSNEETGSTITTDEIGYLNVQFDNIFGLPDSMDFFIEEVILPEVTILIQQPTCYLSEDGVAEVMVTEEFIANALWSDGQTTLNRDDLSSGSYQLLIEWENTCISTYPITIAFSDPIELMNDTNHICINTSETIVPIVNGGAPPYIIEAWESEQIWNTAGEYPLSITDANGCLVIDTLVIDFYPEIHFNYAYDVPCFGESTTLEYYSLGGFGEVVSQFQDTDPSDVYAGNYSVLVTDEAGCYQEYTLIIEENPPIEVSFELTNPDNENQGLIQLEVEGGTPPYNFFWSTSEDDNPLSITSSGSYSCLVSDQLGCSQNIEITAINTSLSEITAIKHNCFPNPSDGIVYYISQSNQQVGIFNTLGKRVQCVQLNIGHNSIDLSQLSTGIYYFFDQGNKITFMKK
ncbi:MAG: FG-GAP-like repeat-containing protein [Flavobacteriales bacterium]|nr:FG-GAP-like repeat-containing protein [Flavobacteriales bacterium]